MTTETTDGAPAEVRAKLAVALDVDDTVAALRLARELLPWIGVAKVGLELYCASGPDIVGGLAELGVDVFCDLKLHDIPTTVHRAARVIGALGARYLNFHAQGGVPMLTAGVDGFLAGASEAGLPAPTPLAVTILTSDGDAPPHILGKRVQAALEAGCGGIVCAASDVREAKQLGPRLVAVVPGIRPAGADVHDQARSATPEATIANGADILVLGRAVTRAADPAAAAAAIAGSITG
jgi:orotidine-5'-phosphate decarboxylase